MTVVRETAKRFIPSSIWSSATDRYARWRREAEWRFSLNRWLSARRLRRFHDKYRRERCFIIGNGPSLKKMDLSPLRAEYTFGLNRIYLLFPELRFTTSFLVCVNRLVVEQCAEDISGLPMPKFLSWRTRRFIRFDANTMLLRGLDSELGFSTDPTRGIHEGATVTYVAMQLAHYMGFQQVILIGVDHSFATQGPAHKEIVSQGDDVDHFSAQYFGKGFRWQLPDLETSERAYRLAREAYEREGREIVDATAGGKLRVFEKVGYDGLF